MSTKSTAIYAKQKHPGCKKVEGQEKPVTKNSEIN